MTEKNKKKTQECKHRWAPLTAKVGEKITPTLIWACLKCGELKVGKQTIRISKSRLDMGTLPIKNIGTGGFSFSAGGVLDVGAIPGGVRTVSLTFIIDGGGSAITTGQKGHLEIPFACTITGWTILADQVGSIVVDVWKDTYANFPPTVADTIAGSEKPTLSSVQKNQDLTLTTWTTAIAAGDILAFNVDSCSTITRVTLSLKVVKS